MAQVPQGLFAVVQVGLAQTGGLDCNFQNEKEEDPNAIGGIREADYVRHGGQPKRREAAIQEAAICSREPNHLDCVYHKQQK